MGANIQVHPSAVVDDIGCVGKGTKIWHFSHVSAGVSIGEECSIGQNAYIASGVIVGSRVKIQNNVSLYEGTIIEDDVFLGPSCVLTNVTNPRSEIVRKHLCESTLIKKGATIGANATLVCGITIGRHAFVGAGAVVCTNVLDYALMLGVPARQKGWMSRHGHFLNFDNKGKAVCPESGWRYLRSDSNEVQCVDCTEESPLPKSMNRGKVPYKDLKKNRL